MTPEGKIKQEICRYLEQRGIFFWVQSASRIPGRRANSPYMRLGVSDILGCINGRLIAIEVKSELGRASVEQRDFLRLVEENGGVSFIAKSVSDVERHLGSLVEPSRSLAV